MAQYSEGWLTVDGNKVWRDKNGNFSNSRPGWGRQTIGEFFNPSGGSGNNRTPVWGGQSPNAGMLLNPLVNVVRDNVGAGFDQRGNFVIGGKEQVNRQINTPAKDRLDRDQRRGRQPLTDRLDKDERGGSQDSDSDNDSNRSNNSSNSTNNASNRNDTRVIPGSGGQTQTGTNMGKINMPGLAELEAYAGGTIANFGGPSFPTQPETNRITAGYPNTSSQQIKGVSESERAQLRDAGFITAGDLEPSQGGQNNQQIDGISEEERGQLRDAGFITAGDLDGFKPGGKFSGAPTATEGQKPVDGIKSERLAAALGDTASMRYKPSEKAADPNKSGIYDDFGGSNPASYATSNLEAGRSAAFLNATDSLAGARAVNRGLGGVRVGGKIIVNNNGTPTEIDQDTWREYRNAPMDEAQALKDKWVASLSNQKKEEPQVPSSAQNPTVQSGTATFTNDVEIDLPGDSKGIDYINNNDEAIHTQATKGKFNADNFKKRDDGFKSYAAEQFYLKK